MREAIRMAREGKGKKEIVSYLVAHYLWSTGMAYTLANAAIYTAQRLRSLDGM